MTKQEEELRKFLQGIAEKEKYKLPKIDIVPITSEGANYTAGLYAATISEQLKPDLHLFAKVANMTEEFRAHHDFFKPYAVEGFFYNEMVLNFDRIYNKNNVPLEARMLIPKYYGHTLTHGNEILVLENLQKNGFHSYDRLSTISWEYASTAVTELAKFHAMGLALRDESQIEFEKISNHLGPNLMMHDQYAEFILKGFEQACEVIDEEYKSRLQRRCNAETYDELRSAMSKKSTMLMFGDFRPSNLMHRCRNGKLEVITLDYQTVMLGNPAYDLIYFSVSCSDEKFRRLHYKNLIEHYFTQLTLALNHLNIDVEKVYPRRTFENDVIEFEIAALFLGLAFTPLLVVDPKDAPEEVARVEGLSVKPNALAVERMNELVRVFAKSGKI